MKIKTFYNTPMVESMIECAIKNKVQIFIRYKDKHGDVTERAFTPVEWKGGNGKGILARCGLRHEWRHFKLHRVERIFITDYDFDWYNEETA